MYSLVIPGVSEVLIEPSECGPVVLKKKRARILQQPVLARLHLNL
jgi:hypothetical protein